MAGAPLGNTNFKDGKIWRDAIKRAVLADDGKRLRAIAEKLLDKASEGDVAAIKELGDRIDGKAAQAVMLAGDEGGGPVRIEYAWAKPSE